MKGDLECALFPEGWVPNNAPGRPKHESGGKTQGIPTPGTPYTLDPTPYALNPTPYTLHPTPYTLLPTF